MNSTKDHFPYPECWNNDSRMTGLFAPFRPKTVNPTDWESKMTFWESMIDLYCKHFKRPMLDLAELHNFFLRNGQKPACLGPVLKHLAEKGTLQSLEEFHRSTEQSWTKWAVRIFVSSPMQWTINKLKSAVVAPAQKETPYFIHLPTVKYLTAELSKSVSSDTKGKLLTLDNVFKLSGMSSKNELLLILEWLQANKRACIMKDAHSNELVKFAQDGDNGVTISEVDIGLYKLEQHEKLLMTNIDKLEEERKEALENAKKHVRAKMLPMAKSSLRRKRELERYIEKRLAALENIQSLLSKIKQAETDSAVFECYKVGIAALKTTLKENGLTEINVTSTMDELQDTLEDQQDIEDIMSRSLTSDVDLEDELNQILAQGSSDLPPDDTASGPHGQDTDPILSLPNVPSDSLGTKRTQSEENLLQRLHALSL